MKTFGNRRRLLGVAPMILVLLNAAPSLAQDVAVPCSAFARNAHGGWKVLAPVMIDVDGRVLGPMVGLTLASGSSINGIKMSDMLDRECRNR